MNLIFTFFVFSFTTLLGISEVETRNVLGFKEKIEEPEVGLRAPYDPRAHFYSLFLNSSFPNKSIEELGIEYNEDTYPTPFRPSGGIIELIMGTTTEDPVELRFQAFLRELNRNLTRPAALQDSNDPREESYSTGMNEKMTKEAALTVTTNPREDSNSTELNGMTREAAVKVTSDPREDSYSTELNTTTDQDDNTTSSRDNSNSTVKPNLLMDAAYDRVTEPQNIELQEPAVNPLRNDLRYSNQRRTLGPLLFHLSKGSTFKPYQRTTDETVQPYLEQRTDAMVGLYPQQETTDAAVTQFTFHQTTVREKNPDIQYVNVEVPPKTRYNDLSYKCPYNAMPHKCPYNELADILPQKPISL